MKIIRNLVIFLLFFCPQIAVGQTMKFSQGGNDVRFCLEPCSFIQATGSITDATPGDFELFLKENPYAGRRVRLHSPGGSLSAGLKLGELFRRLEVTTEVGLDEPDPTMVGVAGAAATRRKPGTCASSCAYAFLGGIKRVIEEGDKFGVHRFYRESALTAPSQKLFSGEDLDSTQRMTAALVLYMVKVGADARLIAFADEASPESMRWLSVAEATELRVRFDPRRWSSWRIEPYRGGVIAMSETGDGDFRVVASCTRKRGPQVVLTSKRSSHGEWFEQCRNVGFENYHIIFGEKVAFDRTEVIRFDTGGGSIRFRLPTARPALKSPEIFAHSTNYPTMCSTYAFSGTIENFAPSVQAAMKNCFND